MEEARRSELERERASEELVWKRRRRGVEKAEGGMSRGEK